MGAAVTPSSYLPEGPDWLPTARIDAQNLVCSSAELLGLRHSQAGVCPPASPRRQRAQASSFIPPGGARLFPVPRARLSSPTCLHQGPPYRYTAGLFQRPLPGATTQPSSAKSSVTSSTHTGCSSANQPSDASRNS